MQKCFSFDFVLVIQLGLLHCLTLFILCWRRLCVMWCPCCVNTSVARSTREFYFQVKRFDLTHLSLLRVYELFVDNVSLKISSHGKNIQIRRREITGMFFLFRSLTKQLKFPFITNKTGWVFPAQNAKSSFKKHTDKSHADKSPLNPLSNVLALNQIFQNATSSL